MYLSPWCLASRRGFLRLMVEPEQAELAGILLARRRLRVHRAMITALSAARPHARLTARRLGPPPAARPARPRHLRELLAAVVYNTLLLLQLLARKELDPGTVALVQSAEHENA